MNPVAVAALKLGLISPAMRAQFAQWGEVADIEPLETISTHDVDELIERALQSDEAVTPKVTNLELIQQYCTTQRLGKLHLTMNGVEASFDVVFGVTRSGDIILPWRSEDIRDVLLDRTTKLEWVSDGESRAVRFQNVEDNYFGETKVFMVCSPKSLSTRA